MRNFFEINQMEDTVRIKTELEFDMDRDQNVSDVVKNLEMLEYENEMFLAALQVWIEDEDW